MPKGHKGFVRIHGESYKLPGIKKRKSSTEYYSWTGMKARCYSVNNPKYPNYGGRGILVCDRWKNSYLNFLADMGRKPSIKHSLDRINNDGNYEPSNCRWATNFEQSINKQAKKIQQFSDEALIIELKKRGYNVIRN